MRRPRSTSKRHVRRSREERRVIRVYPEGSVTEYEYLRHWERANRSITLDWGESGMSPLSLVSRARDDCRLSQRSAKRDGAPQFDEIWCVFDVDTHPQVHQAIFEATQSGVNVAVSNPCFELWLVLHSHDQRAHVDGRAIQRQASNLGLIDGKSVPEDAWGVLDDNYEDARRRAKDLDHWHEGNGSPPRSNPSTDVWRLVDRLRS